MDSSSFFNFWANRPSNNNAPVLGSLAPTTPAISSKTADAANDQDDKSKANLIEAYEKFKEGNTRQGLETAANAFANAFLKLGNEKPAEMGSLQLSPLRGPSTEQSQALLRLLQNMQSKTNNGGML